MKGQSLVCEVLQEREGIVNRIYTAKGELERR